MHALIATGVTADGKLEIIGLDVATCEDSRVAGVPARAAAASLQAFAQRQMRSPAWGQERKELDDLRAAVCAAYSAAQALRTGQGRRPQIARRRFDLAITLRYQPSVRLAHPSRRYGRAVGASYWRSWPRISVDLMCRGLVRASVPRLPGENLAAAGGVFRWVCSAE